MKAKETDLLRLPGGEVLTLTELIDRGEITFSRSDRFATRNGAIRTAYFADHTSGYCVEISAQTFRRHHA